MKKEDLKLGNIIELRDGRKYIKTCIEGFEFIRIDYTSATSTAFFPLNEFDNDLKGSIRKLDIMKVYEDYALKKVLWKRPEPKPELSAKERNILVQALSDGYRWIARNKDNEVWLFDVKPYKAKFCGIEVWLNGFENNVHPLILCKDLFTFLNWEDKKPTKIKDLLIAEE